MAQDGPVHVQGTQGSDSAAPAGSAPIVAPATPGPSTPSAPSPAHPPSDAASPPGTPAPDATPRPSFTERLPIWTVPAVLVGILALTLAGMSVSEPFAEEVVWQYYWGPIKADANGCGGDTDYYGAPNTAFGCSSAPGPHRVAAHSGYNRVNTLSWAVLLGLCILGVRQMLDRYRTPMDERLILGATAWVVIGSIFHVLEDAGLLRAPLQYFFITPPIYLLFAAFGILSFLVGVYLRSVAERAGIDRALQKLWIMLCGPVLVYMLLWQQRWDGIVAYVNPGLVALFAAATFFLVRFQVRRQGRVDPTQMVLSLSLGWFLLSLAYVALYLRDPWSQPRGAYPPAVLVAPGLAAGATALVWMAGRMLAARNPGSIVARALTAPLSLLIVFSQLLDGFATAIGIDFHGYSEKHVVSAGLIDLTRETSQDIGWAFGARYPTFVGFVPVKFLLSMVFLYIIDVSPERKAAAARTQLAGAPPVQEDAPSPTVVGLVKFAIIMVGLGPGIRDFLRLALGV